MFRQPSPSILDLRESKQTSSVVFSGTECTGGGDMELLSYTEFPTLLHSEAVFGTLTRI
jgi:hypothetical protein